MIKFIILVTIISITILGVVDSICKSIKHKKINNSEFPDSEYWWYNAPHYYIMSNGEKFNIPEYVTWDDWKNMPKEKKMQLLLNIENRILSTRNDNFLENSNEDIQ